MSDPMLSGLRIVSFCHYLQGPAATQYLADMGADVIKVEGIDGAFERGWSGGNSYVDGISAFFLGANRNKRVLSVNLKTPEGKEALLRLIDTADAVVENFRPGVLDRLGLGYEAIRQRKPDIVYASASGFGSSGPYATRPGQDLLAQALGGLVHATGDGRTAIGAAAVDQHGAALLALGVMAGLLRKLLTGTGTRVESNLLNAAIDLHAESLVNYYSAGHGPERFARDPRLVTWFHEAPYGVYDIADARIIISANDPVKLARAVGSAELMEMADCDRYEERDRYVAVLGEAIRTRRLAEITAAFDAEALWWAPVQNFEQLREDPQALHNQVFREVAVGKGTATLVNHPVRYDGEVPPLRHLGIEIGQNSRAILAELGYGPDEIEAMAEAGVIRGPAGGGGAV